jgi:hypothetical protein
MYILASDYLDGLFRIFKFGIKLYISRRKGKT